jgi:hypothetical protein
VPFDFLQPLPKITFAKSDAGLFDPAGVALNKALYNYMHGSGLDEDVRSWFQANKLRVPKTRVPRHFIERALASA